MIGTIMEQPNVESKKMKKVYRYPKTIKRDVLISCINKKRLKIEKFSRAIRPAYVDELCALIKETLPPKFQRREIDYYFNKIMEQISKKHPILKYIIKPILLTVIDKHLPKLYTKCNNSTTTQSIY